LKKEVQALRIKKAPAPEQTEERVAPEIYVATPEKYKSGVSSVVRESSRMRQ
jgi:hypothetical protein